MAYKRIFVSTKLATAIKIFAAYPISSFTWILVYKDQTDAAKAKVVVDFLNWATHDGQSLAAPLHYAPLPKEFIPLVEKKLKSISAGGAAVLAQ